MEQERAVGPARELLGGDAHERLDDVRDCRTLAEIGRRPGPTDFSPSA
jgi:hypothetical protein